MKMFTARHAAIVVVLGVPVAALGLPFAGPASAQMEAPPSAGQNEAPPAPPRDGGPRRGGPEHQLERLQYALSLTPEQSTQVKTILEGEHSKMDALHGNSAAAPEERHTQMMAIHGDTAAKIRVLLTPDQVTKYDAMEARMREHRPGAGGAPPPPPQ